jgi:hypothetical protein
MKQQAIVRLGIVLFLVFGLVVPLASAASVISQNNDYLEQDSPDTILALKNHIAFVGDDQRLRMNGAIEYIDNISNGAGTTRMKWIEHDYLVAVSSIPLMYTSDEITEAREEMQRQSVMFADETQKQILMFNGNITDMRESIRVSTQSSNESFDNNSSESLWLARNTARLNVFINDSEMRSSLLKQLGRKNVNTTEGWEISNQIDAKRSDIIEAIRTGQKGSIQIANAGIKQLNQQFRNQIDLYESNLRIQKTVAILAMR